MEEFLRDWCCGVRVCGLHSRAHSLFYPCSFDPPLPWPLNCALEVVQQSVRRSVVEVVCSNAQCMVVGRLACGKPSLPWASQTVPQPARQTEHVMTDSAERKAGHVIIAMRCKLTFGLSLGVGQRMEGGELGTY